MTDNLHTADTMSVPIVHKPAIASMGDTIARLNALLEHSSLGLYVNIGKIGFRIRQFQPWNDEYLICLVAESDVARLIIRWDTVLFTSLTGKMPFQ